MNALEKLMGGVDHGPKHERSVFIPDHPLVVIRGDQATEKPLRWMWKPYLPLEKLVHFGGNSSQAKSPLTVDLAARISVGAPWPDGTPNDKARAA